MTDMPPGTVIARGRELLIRNHAGEWLAPGVLDPMPPPDNGWAIVRTGWGDTGATDAALATAITEMGQALHAVRLEVPPTVADAVTARWRNLLDAIEARLPQPPNEWHPEGGPRDF